MRQAIYVTVSEHHSQVLDALKTKTEKCKRTLMMEGIELLAIHYGLFKKPTDIFQAALQEQPNDQIQTRTMPKENENEAKI